MSDIQFVTIGPYDDFMSRMDTARYLNTSLPTFDLLIAQTKSGKLNPPLPIFRLTPKSKPFFRKSKIDEWIDLRELAKR